MTIEKRPTKSDLRKIDRHQIDPKEYDEAPEFTDQMLARAEIAKGGEIIRPLNHKSSKD